MMSRPSGTADEKPTLSRRQFLAGTGAAVTVAFASWLSLPHSAALASASSLPDVPAMLIDLTRCVGCGSCARACASANELSGSDDALPGLSKDAFTFVEQVPVRSVEGETVRYVKRQCMHCLHPACVAACPAAAMYNSEEGPVVYRPSRCLGCRYCQVACPFGVPAFDWENPITPRISKCWFCYQRQLEGEPPACAASCPTGALRVGTREAMLAEAHGRIATAPESYVDHVFGEHEVGGTSMLYLSDVPFESLGFPSNLGTEPVTVAAEKLMRSLPAVILGMGTLAIGTAYYRHRSADAEHFVDIEPETIERRDQKQ